MKTNLDEILKELRQELGNTELYIDDHESEIASLREKAAGIEGEIRGLERAGEIIKDLSKGDGVALQSIAHPKGSGIGRGKGRLHRAALETYEIDAATLAPVSEPRPVPPTPRRSKIERAVMSALQAQANIPMTCHQLAVAAGVSDQSTSRFLARAITRNLIEKRGGRYVLAAEGAK